MQLRMVEMGKSCTKCQHLISYQADVVCFVFCDIRDDVDFTFSSDNIETTANSCKFYTEDEDSQ